MKLKIFFLAVLSTLCSNSNYAAINSQNIQMLVGKYSLNDWHEPDRPLLVQSNDEGKTWFYQSIQVPTKMFASLSSTSCNSHFCIAGGFNRIAPIQDVGEQLVLTSQDNGKNWVNVPSDVFANYKAEYYLNLPLTTCNDKFCVFGSLYKNGTGNNVVIATTADGSTWSFPLEKIKHVEDESLNDLTCNNELCVAIGEEGIDSYFIARSTDYGQHWSYASSINIPKGFVWSVSCNSKICLIAGDDGGGTYTMPFLAISHDKGDTWQPINTKIFKKLTGVNQFSQIKCNEKVCIGVGDQEDFSPMMVVSQNDGKTWSMVPLKFSNFKTLNSVSCNEKVCVAAGGSQRDDGDPLLLLSYDNGKTWQEQKNFPLPARGTYSLLKASCTESSCVVAGYDRKLNKPIVFVSYDDGKTWIYPDSISKTPENFHMAEIRNLYSRVN